MIELFRRDQNPWGQDILIGVSWDLMWAAVILSVVFFIGHAIWFRTRAGAKHEAPAGPARPSAASRESTGASG